MQGGAAIAERGVRGRSSQRSRGRANAADGPFSAADWILGWGAAAEVLEPERLRQEIATEARKIAEREA